MPEYDSPTTFVPVGLQQEFLRWLNSPEDVLLWIEHTLKGEIIGEKEGKECWMLPENGEALMNDKGVRALLQVLRFYLNKFTFHSRYEENEINDTCRMISNDIDILLFLRWREFGIKQEMLYSDVVSDGIIGMIENAYRMSGMREFYKDVFQAKQIMMPQEKQKGIIGRVFRRGE